MKMGAKHKDWGQSIKKKDHHSNPPKVSHTAFFLPMLLLATFQCKAETGFAAKAPTVDAGVVTRLKVSYRLLI